MAYTTSEARQELLDTVAQAVNELGFASACLAEAYERLDQYNGDRLEAECFRPVQLAYGRAKRTHSEFAVRHGFAAATFEPQPTGLVSQGAASFVARAVEAVGAADRTLADLQDSMLPVEAGDEELRAGIKAVREPLGGLPGSARDFLRGLGR
jgi:class 3 adenylate cyclase